MGKIYVAPSSLIPDKITTINGVKVNEYLIKKHNVNNIALPAKRSISLLGVTIHNTEDLPKIEDDGRNYTASTCNDNMNSVRVHLYVDDLCAWKNLDWTDENWSCADGRGKGNTETIAIEVIMDGKTGTANTKAMDNAARLAAWLLYSNDLTADNLYTHTHWLNVRDGIGKNKSRDYLNTLPHSYKTCPIYIIPQWQEFKKLVDTYIVKLGGKSVSSTTSAIKPNTSKPVVNIKMPYLIQVIDPALNIRSGAGVGNKIVGCIRNKGRYTIIEEKTVDSSVWGKLKSGAGWINVSSKYVKKV